MCGIAGLFDADAIPDADAVKVMTDAVAHRGPDGEGFYARDHVALGHRRLKIIDLSERASRSPTSTGSPW